MIRTDQGHFQHQQGTPMSSVQVLSNVAGGMVQREKTRVGCADAARASVARRIRVGVGSLTNIIKRRVKTVSADVRDRIVAAAIHDLTHEITRLDHERQLLLQMGASPMADDMCRLEGALEAAREAVRRMK